MKGNTAHVPQHMQDTLNEAIRLYNAGDYAEALATAERFLQAAPEQVLAMNIAAACLGIMGKLHEAESYCRRILALQLDHADTHNNLGVLLKRQHRFAEAELSYRRVLALQPNHVEAHNNLGDLFYEQGRLAEAEQRYHHTLNLRPNHAATHHNLGRIYRAQGRPREAEACYRRVLTLLPNNAEAQSDLGVLLHEHNRFTEAEIHYRRAVLLQPNSAEAHNNLGALLHEQRRFDEAEHCYRQVLALQPDYADVHNNLGILLHHEYRRYAESEACYRRAIELNANHATAFNNLGFLLNHFDRCVEAEACYRRALALDPGYMDAQSNLGRMLLYLARFTEGWQMNEIRFDPTRRHTPVIVPDLPFPRWQGEPLHGKSILIYPEQGLGDEIQFVRYLPLLKEAGAARVTLVCKTPLAQLFQTAPGADQVIGSEQGASLAVAAHDFWTFPLSLPLRFGTTLENLPASIPYLSARQERIQRWQPKLPATGFKVGLVWQGNAKHLNDANRSLASLRLLKPLWAIPGISFISLQKGGRGEEEASSPAPDQPLRHLGSEIKDFADTAAIISQLDLLISVDTSVAHLAGALGKACWVLLPCIGTDWRWMQKRSDSPWYPGEMRLFRQERDGDWEIVVANVAQALRETRRHTAQSFA
jgi:Flp pilus assembly protein TadD